jgi:hypothetical protein
LVLVGIAARQLEGRLYASVPLLQKNAFEDRRSPPVWPARFARVVKQIADVNHSLICFRKMF